MVGKGDQNSPITTALSTPLALWLLRKVYIDTRASPAELCDTRRFPTADTLLEHLLDHVIDALIGVNPPHGDDKHLFRPLRAWDPADANRWLAFLAHHLSTIGSRDLAWWQLRRAAPRSSALAGGIIAGLTVGVAVGLYDALLLGLAYGLAGGLILGLVFGLAVRLAKGLTVGLGLSVTFGLEVLSGGVTAGVVKHQPTPGLIFGIAGAFIIAGVGALAVRGIGFTLAQGPAYADLMLRGRTRLLTRKLTGFGDGGLGLKLGVRGIPGLAVGLLFGLVLELAGTVTNGLVSGVVFGAVFGLAAWLAIGLTDWAETPLTNERPQTPTVSFHHDLQLVYVKSLASGFALGVAFGVVGALVGERGVAYGLKDGPLFALAYGLANGLLIAVIIALGVGLHQPSGQYLVTVSVLRFQQQTPLRMLRFLVEAHRLGILREAGPVYQFRHAKLQDRLAQTYTIGADQVPVSASCGSR